jgi:TetR/AcrR family transcriptional regulator, cholesterol catabolism regulator
VARPSRWDEVVASAASVFRRRGFAEATLEEIAENLGMLKGSLYNYISTKADLLAAVIEVPANRLLVRTREVAESDLDSEAKFRALIEDHVDVIVDIYDFAAVYLHEIARQELGSKWKQIDRKYVRLVEDVISDGVDDGTFRADVDPHVATMTVIGACNWLTRWWNPAGPIGREEMTKQITEILIAGLAGPRS